MYLLRRLTYSVSNLSVGSVVLFCMSGEALECLSVRLQSKFNEKSIYIKSVVSLNYVNVAIVSTLMQQI